MDTPSSSHLTGRLLVAMPGIGDPRFERAVVFVCAHDDEHAMGLLINRPVEGLSVSQLLGRLGVKPSVDRSGDRVLLGGPVEGERGFVLHTDDHACAPSSIEVAQGIALTATRDVLEAIAGHNSQPRRSLMALGYAGWGAGQLENELRENVWLTCEADEDLVFGDDHEHKWSRALGKIGVAAEHLSAQAGRA